MTQEATEAGTDGRLAVCLSEIDGLESVIARMPTAGECRDHGLPGNSPVLILRRRGQEQLYPADLIRLTIGSGPPPGPDAARDAAGYAARNILEDLDNVRAKLADFARAVQSPPPEIVRLAAEYSQDRADEFSRTGPGGQ